MFTIGLSSILIDSKLKLLYLSWEKILFEIGLYSKEIQRVPENYKYKEFLFEIGFHLKTQRIQREFYLIQNK
jgi:hypothetical protein